jgi:hypothetical protein
MPEKQATICVDSAGMIWRNAHSSGTPSGGDSRIFFTFFTGQNRYFARFVGVAKRRTVSRHDQSGYSKSRRKKGRDK